MLFYRITLIEPFVHFTSLKVSGLLEFALSLFSCSTHALVTHKHAQTHTHTHQLAHRSHHLLSGPPALDDVRVLVPVVPGEAPQEVLVSLDVEREPVEHDREQVEAGRHERRRDDHETQVPSQGQS